MQHTIRRFLLLSCSISLCLLASSCQRLGPVDKFQTEPATTGELAKNLIGRHPPAPYLWAKMRIVVSGGPVRGRQKLIGYLRYRAPDKLMLQGDHNRFGGILRVTQNGEDAAVYLMKEPVHFYKGSLAELNAHPEALFGLQPTDMVRTLLVGSEVVELLQAVPEDTALPPGPREDFKYWGLATTPAWNRIEMYAIRKADGLTEKISVRDENNVQRILVTYRRYDYFNNVLFPKEFDLVFEGSKLKLRVDVEDVSSEVVPNERVFTTDPPPNAGIEAEPLSDWFARPDLADPNGY